MADGRVENKVKYNILLLCHTKESAIYPGVGRGGGLPYETDRDARRLA